MGTRDRSRRSCAPLESLENRRLFSFAAADASFGDGGLVRLFKSTTADYFDTSKPTLVPLADGRSILYAGGIDDLSQYETTVRYLRADGSTDTARGHGGEIGVHFAQYDTTAITVDPKTGRMAIYAPTYNSTSTGFKIDLYDAKGKKVDTYTFTNTNPIENQSTRMTFAPDGGLIVATQESVQIENSSVTQLLVRRLDKSLNRVKSFGDNGVFTLIQSNVGDAQLGYLSAANPALDAKGNIYLNLFERRPDSTAGGNRYIDRVVRLTANGQGDRTYGDDGVFTVFDRPQNEHGGSTRIIPIDAAVRGDGTIVLLTATTRTGANVTAMSRLDISQITPGKALARLQVGRTQYTTDDQSGRVALDADGDIYVSTRLGGSATQAFRYRLGKKNALAPVDSWSDFGDAAQLTVNISEGDLAVDAAGRVMVVGQASEGHNKTSPAVYRFDGRTTFAKTADGSVQLLKDGTLLVKGSVNSDKIVIDTNGDASQVIATIGQSTKTFDRAKVHGLLVLAGRGNDSINIAANGIGAYLDGGSGNDTLTGSDDRDDTLVGADGNDFLYARAGNDHLYGQDGDDLLLGGNGADELFGGAGSDRLYASGELPVSNEPDDFATDVLDGGKGADVIQLDVMSVYFSQADTLLNRDDADTILNG